MNKTEALQTAETIFTQLGGQKTLKLFVGATNFAFNNLEKEERVEASFKFKGSRKMNHCKVTYRRCPDDYIVEFYKIGRASVTKVSRHEGIYCDMLIELFEKETNLVLHF